MPDKQFLDYEGLKKYHNKVKSNSGNGGFSTSSFSIGDLKMTKNQNQDDTWLYCNGDTLSSELYPELSEILPYTPIVSTFSIPSVSTYGRDAQLSYYANGTFVVCGAYQKDSRYYMYVMWTTDEKITNSTSWDSYTTDYGSTSVRVAAILYAQNNWILVGTNGGTNTVLYYTDELGKTWSTKKISSVASPFSAATDGDMILVTVSDKRLFWSDSLDDTFSYTNISSLVGSDVAAYCYRIGDYWVMSYSSNLWYSAEPASGYSTLTLPFSYAQTYIPQFKSGYYYTAKIVSKKIQLARTTDLASGEYEYSEEVELQSDSNVISCGYADGFYLLVRRSLTGAGAYSRFYLISSTNFYDGYVSNELFSETQSGSLYMSLTIDKNYIAVHEKTILFVIYRHIYPGPSQSGTSSYYTHGRSIYSTAGASVFQLPKISNSDAYVFIKGKV